MKTLNEYIEENGFSIGDFTDIEIEELNKELDTINNGGHILDGVFFEKEIQNYGI